MNELGTECKLHRREMIADIRENIKSYGLDGIAKAAVNAFKSGTTWRLNLADIYGSLVDEAIKRTEI